MHNNDIYISELIFSQKDDIFLKLICVRVRLKKINIRKIMQVLCSILNEISFPSGFSRDVVGILKKEKLS